MKFLGKAFDYAGWTVLVLGALAAFVIIVLAIAVGITGGYMLLYEMAGGA